MDILCRYSLEGRVAVVTGAGRGIGQGIAEDFAKAGAKVILAARRTEEIKQVEQRIRNAGGTAIAVTADVTKSRDLDNLGSTAIKEYGKLTDWVNNAGGSPLRMPAKELPRDEWHKTIALNLTSIYEGCLTAERYMEKGSIINITSGARTGPVPGSAALRSSESWYKFSNMDLCYRIRTRYSSKRSSTRSDPNRSNVKSNRER